jgi:hypothetical protein
MTISGINSPSQVTADVEARLVAAYAESLGIARELVKLGTVKDARRRLLAVVVTFLVLASDAAEATKLMQKAQVANMQVCERPHTHHAVFSNCSLIAKRLFCFKLECWERENVHATNIICAYRHTCRSKA